MAASIFWYDYETSGANPRKDRPLQVAGIRTDENLEIIGEPLNLYCRLSDDILPHPQASLITGITPEQLSEQGVSEAEFMGRLHAELIQPNTCTAGYNSIRFDDEVTRHGLYRTFHDPYAREWQGGNSRWDIIDAMRAAYALRPEGIEWPIDEQTQQVTLRLERLTAANNIDHGEAHNALSDVYATIGLARLLRSAQPKLYQYLYDMRRKSDVQAKVQLLKPMVHVSGRFAASRHYLSVVLPLAWHPTNRNAVIVCDLQSDLSPLLEEDAETIRQRLYTRRDELGEGVQPIPLKLIHLNKCPVIAPLSVIRREDESRLALCVEACQVSAKRLTDTQSIWQNKLAEIYSNSGADWGDDGNDVEQMLYSGLINDRDRALLAKVREGDMGQTGSAPHFQDERLPELLQRYKARNFADQLNEQEQREWYEYCKVRLVAHSAGAPLTLSSYLAAWNDAWEKADVNDRVLLRKWKEYVDAVAMKYQIDV